MYLAEVYFRIIMVKRPFVKNSFGSENRGVRKK
jgi:hypothetical protein